MKLVRGVPLAIGVLAWISLSPVSAAPVTSLANLSTDATGNLNVNANALVMGQNTPVTSLAMLSTDASGNLNINLAAGNPTPAPTATPANTAVPTATAINTPTPIPTCAANIFYAGLGFSCITPVPPTVVPTATPRATDTPAPTATPGSSSNVEGYAGIGNIALVSGSTYYFGLANDSTTENLVLIPMPKAVTVNGLYCQIDAAPGVGKTNTVTLRKNSGATSITFTLSGGAQVAGNDTSHSATYAASDTWDVQYVTAAGAATTGNFACAWTS